ncbi:hypothetical protein BZA70DRAFT_287922 [Myxozyma melibiosi]|uniref:R3H-associated N-terminal domain-containing protein n=1 Tax=Myxozyma melibiosi TaxID=54550 RepID=A0ABR1FFI6_9ASCO
MNDQNSPFPLTEENLQALLRAISDSSLSDSPTAAAAASSVYASPSHSLPHTPLNHVVYGTPPYASSPLAQRSRKVVEDVDDTDDTDVETASLTTVTDIAAPEGVRQVARVASTVVSTPQGSVVNFRTRQAAARIRTDGRRPVQGTRHRRRLENARMLYNPHAVPPTPQDYLPQPMYAIRRIDRDLASYLASRTPITESFLTELSAAEELRLQKIADKAALEPRIPKTLKERVKKGHLTQPFLKGLEEDIREFVFSVHSPEGEKDAEYSVDERELFAKAAIARRDGLSYDESSSTKPVKSENRDPKKKHKEPKEQYLLEKEIEIEPDSEKAESFSRWIVYQIADYYRLSCYTKIVDDRRIPCVVLNVEQSSMFLEMPRAIWTFV